MLSFVTRLCLSYSITDDPNHCMHLVHTLLKHFVSMEANVQERHTSNSMGESEVVRSSVPFIGMPDAAEGSVTQRCVIETLSVKEGASGVGRV